MDREADFILAGALMAGGSEYEIEPENGGRTHAIYMHCHGRRDFICRYQKRENAERHVAKMKEKWG